MHQPWLVIVLSLAAAFSFAASSSLKHVSAGDAPDAQSMSPGTLRSFARATATHRLWLGGLAFDVVGLSLQILALHLGALAVVQPLLVSGMLWALVFRHRFSDYHVTRRQAAWAAATAVALVGFLLFAGTATLARHETADRLPALVSGILGLALAATCTEAGRRQRTRGRSAALLGIAVGVLYAATAALLKALTDIAAAHSLVHVLVSWQLYVVIVVGAAGLLLNQLAFQAGPLTASLPATSTVDPLLSIVIGVLVYDEPIRRGVGGGIVLVALLVLMAVAIFQLARTEAEDQPAAEV